MNLLLSDRSTNMERQCWANALYSRRECLDVIGIPSEVDTDVLKEKVLKIFRNRSLVEIFFQSELKPDIELAKKV